MPRGLPGWPIASNLGKAPHASPIDVFFNLQLPAAKFKFACYERYPEMDQTSTNRDSDGRRVPLNLTPPDPDKDYLDRGYHTYSARFDTVDLGFDGVDRPTAEHDIQTVCFTSHWTAWSDNYHGPVGIGAYQLFNVAD